MLKWITLGLVWSVLAMTGNANATTLTTPLAALATVATALDSAYNAAQLAQAHAQELTMAQNVADDAWDAAFDALADAALVATHGDTMKIQSLALTPYDAGAHAPVGAMAQVLNLVATTGDFAGTVDLAWDKVAGSKSYEVQTTTTPDTEASWHHALTAPRSSGTVLGLTSGTKYWFRVAAIGSAGQGAWSDPATKMAG